MKMQSLSSASFTSYSPSDKVSQIAARVVEEVQSNDDFMLEYNDNKFVNDNNNNNQEDDEEDEGEFEFNLAPLSPIPADEIFSNGQIRPVYPLFNTELAFGKSSPSPARLPLGKLFMEERNNCSSSCSSESDELEGLPAETYCVWRPNTGDNPRELRNKSSSTGTSKRWKLRNLLHKSNSDGNATFDFLNTRKELDQRHYMKNDERRSFLPHKKDLVELFFVSRHVNPY